MQKQFAIAVYILLAVACAYHALYYLPLLPAQVPSNFNLQGEPHGWNPKNSFVTVYLVTVLGVTLCFPVLAGLIAKMPVRWINLPNREYWLSGERRRKTLDDVFLAITWMGSATLFFVMAMFHSCFKAGLGDNDAFPPLPDAGVTGALYGIYLLVHSIWIWVKYKRKR